MTAPKFSEIKVVGEFLLKENQETMTPKSEVIKAVEQFPGIDTNVFTFGIDARGIEVLTFGIKSKL